MKGWRNQNRIAISPNSRYKRPTFYGIFTIEVVLFEGYAMFRRHFLIGLLLAPLALVSSKTVGAADLVVEIDMMKKILRTSTPDDDAFINRVVKQVDKGTLPADLVNSTFIWARRKSKNRFQYFKQALILRASQQGITIKP
jgi:hypothetical protein